MLRDDGAPIRAAPPAVLFAPAKINLNLRVVGRRDDDYHLLESLMVPVSLFDELRISVRPADTVSIRLQSDDPVAPSGTGNTVYAAVESLARAVDLTAAVDIELRKRIPAGSGLGGASSDAAAVLRFLNAALEVPLEAKALRRLAASVGADVPFFLRAEPSHVGGIGERITPYAGWLPPWLVLASALQPLSTAKVFHAYARSLTKQPAESKPLVSAGVPAGCLEIYNDLEGIAGDLESSIPRLVAELSALGVAVAGMSGSGSAVFAVVHDEESAHALAGELGSRGYWARAVESLGAGRRIRDEIDGR